MMEKDGVMEQNTVNVGIGFATGRKNFANVARTYAENWCESGLTDQKNISLNLFVAYDLKYKNTKPADYRNLDKRITDMLDDPFFISESVMKKEASMLVNKGIISKYEAELLFGTGYAKKRNAILYFAIKNKMDYLLYVDDDEYPMAAIKTPDGLMWKGQQVLAMHLSHIVDADITHGYHCGYVSPIPQIRFNNALKEKDFRLFIETISNDIISWDSIKQKMQDGGVTYCDENIINSTAPVEVSEINGAKFISGSNLFINLKSVSKLYPFYNPPGARGEDTFLSTCLSDTKVLKVPCYAFHDGFSTYQHLLCGTLPAKLKPICAGRPDIDERFYRACVGWIRYKPLLLYITKPNEYASEIIQMKENLNEVLPKVCHYFNRNDFMGLLSELNTYSDHVSEHYEMFESTKSAWAKVVTYLKNINAPCSRSASVLMPQGKTCESMGIV
jgi:hypothetical protein